MTEIKIFKSNDIEFCPKCGERLLDRVVNVRDPNNPDIITMKVVVGKNCSADGCKYGGRIYPFYVFEIIRQLKKDKQDELIKTQFFEMFYKSIEAHIWNNQRDIIPEDIWEIYIDIVRENLYKKYDSELPNNHMRRDMNVIYYISNNKIVWGLD